MKWHEAPRELSIRYLTCSAGLKQLSEMLTDEDLLARSCEFKMLDRTHWDAMTFMNLEL